MDSLQTCCADCIRSTPAVARGIMYLTIIGSIAGPFLYEHFENCAQYIILTKGLDRTCVRSECERRYPRLILVWFACLSVSPDLIAIVWQVLFRWLLRYRHGYCCVPTSLIRFRFPDSSC
jgi:hypothetical protein